MLTEAAGLDILGIKNGDGDRKMEWISSSTVLYILAVNGITFLAFGLDKY